MWRAGEATSDPAVRLLRLDAFFAQAPSAHNPQPGDWHWNGLNRSPYAEALEGGRIARERLNGYLIADTLQPDSAWLGRSVESSCWFWHGSAHAGRDALQFEWVCEAEWPDGSRNWLEHVPVAACGEHAGVGPGRPSTCSCRICPSGCTSLPSVLNRMATAFMPTRSG